MLHSSYCLTGPLIGYCVCTPPHQSGNKHRAPARLLFSRMYSSCRASSKLSPAAQPCPCTRTKARHVGWQPSNARSTRFQCTAALDPVKLGAIAAEPVVKVALLCGAGAICAKQSILTLQGRRMLSGLIMNVFTPALLLSKLGSSVDAQQALELWPLAANMVACHVVGLGLGWMQGVLLDIPATLRPQMVVMNTVGNIGNLPLVLVSNCIAVYPQTCRSHYASICSFFHGYNLLLIRCLLRNSIVSMFLMEPQQHHNRLDA